MAIQYTPMDLLQSIKQNDFSYKSYYTKKVVEVNTDVQQLQDNVETFKKNVKGLKKYSPGATTKTGLEKQLKDLVKSYNTMNKNAGAVTDKEVKKQLSKLEKLFSDNEKNLKKIGIDKSNGKYEFHEDRLEDVDDKVINALFTGNDSFINKADKILRGVEESTDDAEYNRVVRKLAKTTKYEQSDVELAAFMVLAQQTGAVMSEYNGVLQSGIPDADIKAGIKEDLKLFAQSVYHVGKDGQNENLDRLNQLLLDNEGTLNKVGISFDSEKKNLIFEENTDMDTADFKDAYDELFGNDAEFGKKVQEYTRNIFDSIVQPDKIGVSVIDVSV